MRRCRSPTPAPAFRRPCSARCSSPSSPPRKSARAPGSACRPSTASSSSRAASSSPIRKVGEGTTLHHLPAGPPRRGRGAARGAGQGQAARRASCGARGTILLVEDEAMVRTVAERALTRHGYKVLTADNGEEALEILDRGERGRPADLATWSCRLMDGPTMVREARKIQPDLPILFMSGYAEEQLRKSIDIANVAFLPKPFSVQRAGRGGAARARRGEIMSFLSRNGCYSAARDRAAFHPDRRGRAADRDDARGFPRIARPQVIGTCDSVERRARPRSRPTASTSPSSTSS